MRRLIAVSLVVLAGGCDRSPSTPTTPTESTVVVTGLSPASGSTVVVPREYPYTFPGGVALPPRSGLISVGLTLTLGEAVSERTQLNVYLLTGNTNSEYCGQNDPDSPTWRALPAGWTTTYAVTGFRFHRLPCDVTGIRAMLHTRNNGLFAPPLPSETVAEVTVPASLAIRLPQ